MEEMCAHCGGTVPCECGDGAEVFPEPQARELTLTSPDAIHLSEAPMNQAPEIPGYKTESYIGGGGMGNVWRARQEETGNRQVALKTMGGPLGASRVAVERFKREIKLAATLQHENIARVFDAGEHAGALYYTMELVEAGLPITEYAKAEQLSPHDRIRLGITLCRAMHHAHKQGEGIIHRDLKPDNILVGKEGVPKILDFGLAKSMQEEAGPNLTLTNAIAGTPLYMSPEQAAGEKIDHRTDVFSLGLILHELLLGKLPWRSTGLNTLIEEIRTRPVAVPRLSSIDAGRNRDLQLVLGRALEFSPDHRYQSVREMEADLQAILENRPIAARSASLGYVCRKWVRRHRLVSARAGLCAALLFVGVTAALITSKRSEKRLRATALQAQSEGLYSRGQQKMSRGELREAAALFEQSWEMLPRWETALQLQQVVHKARELWDPIGEISGWPAEATECAFGDEDTMWFATPKGLLAKRVGLADSPGEERRFLQGTDMRFLRTAGDGRMFAVDSRGVVHTVDWEGNHQTIDGANVALPVEIGATNPEQGRVALVDADGVLWVFDTVTRTILGHHRISLGPGTVSENDAVHVHLDLHPSENRILVTQRLPDHVRLWDWHWDNPWPDTVKTSPYPSYYAITDAGVHAKTGTGIVSLWEQGDGKVGIQYEGGVIRANPGRMSSTPVSVRLRGMAESQMAFVSARALIMWSVTNPQSHQIHKAVNFEPTRRNKRRPTIVAFNDVPFRVAITEGDESETVRIYQYRNARHRTTDGSPSMIIPRSATRFNTGMVPKKRMWWTLRKPDDHLAPTQLLPGADREHPSPAFTTPWLENWTIDPHERVRRVPILFPHEEAKPAAVIADDAGEHLGLLIVDEKTVPPIWYWQWRSLKEDSEPAIWKKVPELSVLERISSVHAFRITRNGEFHIAGYGGGGFSLDVNTGDIVRRFGEGKTRWYFSPRGTRAGCLISQSGKPSLLEVWDCTTGQRLLGEPLKDSGMYITFVDEEYFTVSNERGGLEPWTVRGGQSDKAIPSEVYPLAYHPAGHRMVALQRAKQVDNTDQRVMDQTGTRSLMDIGVRGSGLNRIQFLDEETMVRLSDSETCYIFRSATPQQAKERLARIIREERGYDGQWDRTSGRVSNRIIPPYLCGVGKSTEEKSYAVVSPCRFTELQALARSTGTTIPTFISSTEERALGMKVYTHKHLWLGVAPGRDGTAMDLDGQPLAYTNWRDKAFATVDGSRQPALLGFTQTETYWHRHPDLATLGDSTNVFGLLTATNELQMLETAIDRLPVLRREKDPQGRQYILLAPCSFELTEAWAKRHGGHMMVVNTAEEERFIREAFYRYTHVWTGLKNPPKTSAMEWTQEPGNLELFDIPIKPKAISRIRYGHLHIYKDRLVLEGFGEVQGFHDPHGDRRPVFGLVEIP